jgi:23S rRNA (adenine2503-C2)-methyltransferase
MDQNLPVTLRQAGEMAAADGTPGGVHLPGLQLAELRAWLVGAGQPRYRTEQIADWVFVKRVERFDQMTNLSKDLRARLTEHAAIYRSTIARQSVSTDQTQKLLLAWPDGATVETVWIPEPERNTACLSSQVGCPVGCRFCASGLNGLQRNLTAGEIVEQALRIARLIDATASSANDANPAAPEVAVSSQLEAPAQEQSHAAALASAPRGRRRPTDDPISATSGEAQRPARLTNIVMMGMGEPLANYAEVVKAIRILNAPWGLGIGARKITVSTVGLPKQIRQLAEEELQLNLALSLHAPDQKLREELIPWGKVPLAELLAACDYYFRKTGREITLEYVLLDDVNNQPAHARQLAQIAKRLRCNINLLRYNPVPGLPYERPTSEATREFQQRLRDVGVNAHVRTSRGKDIEAACGQLRRGNLAAPSAE